MKMYGEREMYNSYIDEYICSYTETFYIKTSAFADTSISLALLLCSA
jgi:hypothetical protein